LVAVLLSFIYATPVELGFDPNVKGYTPTEGGCQYFVYTVNDKTAGPVYFKTSQSLSEYRSCCISGRATRVWKVEQIKSLLDHSPVNCEGKVLVLKDIWLEQDAKTERELQTNLFKDIRAFIAQGHFPQLESPKFETLIRSLLVGERWKKHFLTITFDGDGEPSKKCPVSARPNSTLFHKPLSRPIAPLSQAADQSRAYSASVLHEQTPLESVALPAPRKYAPKRRYIVVFEELCETVENLTSFTDTMNALKDAVQGVLFSMSFLSPTGA
jgi:hypothetical protein